ncbi:MAG: c-type cytochrome [Proteobacteria bacterium]|jgi:cytochrome c5|nr:c-type cytochrome [Pseudomonadota bacterium]
MAQKDNASSRSMVITIIVSIVLIIVIWPLSQMGKGGAPAYNPDDADLRIQPVARVEFKKAAPAAAAGPRDGATVYNTVCMACHAGGVAGAPKTGDKAAWAPRIATGDAALLKSVINGKGAMPPRGGGADLSDDEIKAAVAHLVGLAK